MGKDPISFIAFIIVIGGTVGTLFQLMPELLKRDFDFLSVIGFLFAGWLAYYLWIVFFKKK